MSDQVSGSVSRGRGNKMVSMDFSGPVKQGPWEAFIEQIKQVAKNNGVTVVVNVGPKAAKPPHHR